jgi:hypothetical protein
VTSSPSSSTFSPDQRAYKRGRSGRQTREPTVDKQKSKKTRENRKKKKRIEKQKKKQKRREEKHRPAPPQAFVFARSRGECPATHVFIAVIFVSSP